MLVASVCIAAFVVAPIASASATAGECTIEGKATFETPAGVPTNIKTTLQKYKFGPTKVGSCKELAPGTENLEFEEAEAKGEGELSCPVGAAGFDNGTGAPGKGFLKTKKTGEKKFTIKFLAAAANVPFLLQGDPTASTLTAAGNATFANDLTSVESCFVNGEASSLKFTAIAVYSF
jgi:hypothetical protein